MSRPFLKRLLALRTKIPSFNSVQLQKAFNEIDESFANLENGLSKSADSISEDYLLHFYAPAQQPTDKNAMDLTGTTDGVFGTNLSIAEAWVNPGYVSTKAPATGLLDSAIAFPPLSWDYAAGESLLIFWRGVFAPKAGTMSVMGQAATASQKGIQLRCTAAGQLELVLRSGNGTDSYFVNVIPNAAGKLPFVANEEHSFMIAFDPVARNAQIFVDGLYITTFTVNTYDTYNATTPFRLGMAAAVPVLSDGSDIKTKALVILHNRFNKPLPTDLPLLARTLHRNPNRFVTAKAW